MVGGTLRAVSAAAMDKHELDFGDKVILPSRVLEAVLQHDEHPWPLSFELRHGEKRIHAGVQSFTPEPNTIIIPGRIMLFLGLSDGDEVSVKSVKLPKGVFCQLQPLESSWNDIPWVLLAGLCYDSAISPLTSLFRFHRVEDRQGILEFELRRFVPAPERE